MVGALLDRLMIDEMGFVMVGVAISGGRVEAGCGDPLVGLKFSRFVCFARFGPVHASDSVNKDKTGHSYY